MTLLISGVILWWVVHLFKSVTPGARAALGEKIGDKSVMGIAALLILGSVGLMVAGWRSADYSIVYDPPIWGRHLHMATMFIAIWLFGVANVPSKVKKIVAHPMLTGFLIWAVGHLLANGDSRSLVLFGGLGLWALISIFTINGRDGKPVPPEARGWGREVIGLVVAAAVYGILFMTHRWYAGMPLMG